MDNFGIESLFDPVFLVLKTKITIKNKIWMFIEERGPDVTVPLLIVSINTILTGPPISASILPISNDGREALHIAR